VIDAYANRGLRSLAVARQVINIRSINETKRRRKKMWKILLPTSLILYM